MSNKNNEIVYCNQVSNEMNSYKTSSNFTEVCNVYPFSGQSWTSNISRTGSINYRNELCLYFYHEMLPYIIEEIHEPESSDLSIDETNFVPGSGFSILPEQQLICDSTGSISMTSGIKPSISRKSTESKASSRPKSKKQTLITISDISSVPSISKDTELDWFVERSLIKAHIHFKNGCLYRGDLKNGIFHGKGIFRWSDGACYDGEFSKGQMTGYGEFTYTEGSKFTGQFCNGWPHGYGCFNCVGTQMIYDGEWKYGKKDGDGWLLYDKSSIYRGQFKDDRQTGMGKREYSNGAIYYGSWLNGHRHGEGTMLFENKDFYKGEWANGKPHGYGEYTWNASLNYGFALAQENIYQGQWVNGEREGYGVIHFGQDGTKLASYFKNNMKHGAGIMICSNGKAFEKSPLFIKDSPVHGDEMEPETVQFFKKLNSLYLVDIRGPYTNKKHHVSFIAESPSYFPSHNKIDKTFPVVHPKETPLQIPFHAPPTDLQLDFHLEKILGSYSVNTFDPELFGINPSKWNVLKSFNLSEIMALQLNSEDLIDLEFEERKLRNTLIVHFPYLQQLYNKYGSLTCKTDDFKPVLSRMFLWQMYRDFGLHNHGISLLDTDTMLLEYPDNYLETAHYPLEKIYMWQFLHSLLCVTSKIYATPAFFEKNKELGIFSKMFENFLQEIVAPNAGKGLGQCLFKYKDLLPINSVYSLYRSIGEPLSVRTFIKRCCLKKGTKPPCYLKSTCMDKPPVVPIACNAVCTGSNFIYLSEEPDRLGKRAKEQCPCPFEHDEFYKNLMVFRFIGVPKLLSFVAQICPLIKSEDFIVNIDYKMTFLEFYEVLLLCAEELFRLQKIKDEKRLKMAAAHAYTSFTTKKDTKKESRRKISKNKISN